MHAVPAQMLKRPGVQYMSKTDDKSTATLELSYPQHGLRAGTTKHIVCFSDAVAQVLQYLTVSSQRKTHKAHWVIVSMTMKSSPTTKV